MPRDEDVQAQETEREAKEAGTPLHKYVEQTDPYVQYAKQMAQNPVQTIPEVTVEGDPDAAEAERRAAQEEVDGGQAQPLDLGSQFGARGAGGFASTMSPETRAIYESAFGRAAETVPVTYERSAAAAQEAEDIRRENYDQARRQVAAQAGKAWGAYHQMNDEVRRAQEVYQAASDEADDALREVREAKIDPNRYWHERDTFTNVMGALSAAMGGFFSVYTGQNPAADTINRAIDRDIRAQEADLKKKEGYADTLLRRNMARSRDLESARERTRLQMTEVARLTAQKMAMDSGDAQAEAAFAKLDADLQNRRDQSLADLALRYAQYRAQSEGRLTGARLDLVATAEKDAAAYVPSLGGLARGGAGEASKLRDTSVKTQQLRDILDHAATVREQMGGLEEAAVNYPDVTKTPQYLQLKSDFARSINLANVLAGQGAISHGDAERAQAAVADFGNLTLPKAAALRALNVVNQELGRQFQYYRESIIPAQEHVVRYNGRIMRVYTQDVQDRPPPGKGGGAVRTTPLPTPKPGR